eukprot:jgi/Botrbrau1/19973/Bobra.0059s0088.1
MSLRKRHYQDTDEEAFYIEPMMSERLMDALKPGVQIDNVWKTQTPYESQSGYKRDLDMFGNELEEETPSKRTKDCENCAPAACPEVLQTDHSDVSCDTEADLCCPELLYGSADVALLHTAPSTAFHALNNPGCYFRPSSACSGNETDGLSSSGDLDASEVIDMIRNMMMSEMEVSQNAGCLARHGREHLPDTFLEEGMRGIALSWLVEVACEFGFHQETLFLAASLVDRFLAKTQGVERAVLQLISVACMMIAAKHEEEHIPSADKFTTIADNSFEQEKLVRTESVILSCLGFRVMTPHSFGFMSLLQQLLQFPRKVGYLASFILELAMLEYDFLEFRPSTLAAAAVLLADCIVTTNEAYCKRDLCFSNAKWHSSASASSSTCYLSFMTDPATGLLCHSPLPREGIPGRNRRPALTPSCWATCSR